MGEKEMAAKERILTSAMDVLRHAENPESITVRQLAERAGVAVGAINYHFQSKDNLLNLAVGRLMVEAAAQWYQPKEHREVDAVTRLRRLVKESAALAFRYRKLSAMAAAYELMNGDFNVPLLVVPLLREILGEQRSEQELRLLAFQLIIPTQVILLRADAFKRYSGCDPTIESEREAMVDMLIDHLIQHPK